MITVSVMLLFRFLGRYGIYLGNFVALIVADLVLAQAILIALLLKGIF